MDSLNTLAMQISILFSIFMKYFCPWLKCAQHSNSPFFPPGTSSFSLGSHFYSRVCNGRVGFRNGVGNRIKLPHLFFPFLSLYPKDLIIPFWQNILLDLVISLLAMFICLFFSLVFAFVFHFCVGKTKKLGKQQFYYRSLFFVLTNSDGDNNSH